MTSKKVKLLRLRFCIFVASLFVVVTGVVRHTTTNLKGSVEGNVVRIDSDPAGIFSARQTGLAGEKLSERRNMVDKIRCRRYWPQLRGKVTCQTELCEALSKLVSERESIKVILGAGGTSYPGWIATDFDTVDLLDPSKIVAAFPSPGSVQSLLAEHVLEHFDVRDVLVASEAAYCLLKPGGRLRVAVPETLFPDRQLKIYGSWGVQQQKTWGYPGHHSAWDATTLAQVLQLAGFHTLPLEFFDTSGNFHKQPWSGSDGYIMRSAEHDWRNKNGTLQFTSVIIDALKPPLL